MFKRVVFLSTLLLLTLLLIFVTLINNQFLRGLQVDLTEKHVYSLSEGTKSILSHVDEPIDLYFFFSHSSTKGMTSLRNYADRVERLLHSYEVLSNGNIRLHVVDPEPFSNEETKASELGLTPIQLGRSNDTIYFGLFGNNLLDDQLTIPFFDAQQERFLEYEISKLVYRLSQPHKPLVAVVTDLPVEGGFNILTNQFNEPMAFYSQLSHVYNVVHVKPSATRLPQGTDLLVLIHPNMLTEPLKVAIDSHVMKTGKLVAFVDPYFESIGSFSTAAVSDFSLLEHYGVELPKSRVVFDLKLGLNTKGTQGQSINQPGNLRVSSPYLNNQDVVTANLDTVTLLQAGALAPKADSKLTLIPLLQSSFHSELINTSLIAQLEKPYDFSRLLSAQGRKQIMGGRFTGTISSKYQKNTSVNAELLVFADADMLVDSTWIESPQIESTRIENAHTDDSGKQVSTPFADNGKLVINAIDNLIGSADLISVRTRGTYARPFLKVNDLKADADAKYKKQEQQLQTELEQVELMLSQLQKNIESKSEIVTPKMERSIELSNIKRADIRHKLREVRLQLNRDITTLGNQIKLLNIIGTPLIAIIILSLLVRVFRTKAPRFKGDNEHAAIKNVQ